MRAAQSFRETSRHVYGDLMCVVDKSKSLLGIFPQFNVVVVCYGFRHMFHLLLPVPVTAHYWDLGLEGAGGVEVWTSLAVHCGDGVPGILFVCT